MTPSTPPPFDPDDPLHAFRMLFEPPGEDAADPESVRVEKLTVSPLDDGRRVTVTFSLTPYRFRPHLVLWIHNTDGEEVATMDIIEPPLPYQEITLHLPPIPGEYTLTLEVRYPIPEHMPQDPMEQRLSRGELKPLPPMRTVARATARFTLPEGSV